LGFGDRPEITKIGICGENESVAKEFVGASMKVRKELAISAARQAALTDKLLNPPRCGGKSKAGLEWDDRTGLFLAADSELPAPSGGIGLRRPTANCSSRA
jgi:hypothetical protein